MQRACASQASEVTVKPRGNLFQLLDFHIALSANQNVEGLQHGDAFGVSLLSSHLAST